MPMKNPIIRTFPHKNTQFNPKPSRKKSIILHPSAHHRSPDKTPPQQNAARGITISRPILSPPPARHGVARLLCRWCCFRRPPFSLPRLITRSAARGIIARVHSFLAARARARMQITSRSLGWLLCVRAYVVRAYYTIPTTVLRACNFAGIWKNSHVAGVKISCAAAARGACILCLIESRSRGVGWFVIVFNACGGGEMFLWFGLARLVGWFISACDIVLLKWDFIVSWNANAIRCRNSCPWMNSMK